MEIVIVNAGEPSHPAKRLRDDHGALGGPAVGGKSRSMVQRLLVGAVQNAKDGYHTESLAGADLRTIGAPQRFVISSDSSHHSSVNVAEAEVNFVVRTSMSIMTSVTTTTPTVDLVVIAKEKLVDSSVFGVDSSSAGGSHPFPGGFSDSTGSDFLIGGIRIVIDPESNVQKVYVPQWNVTNGSRLYDGGVYREMMSLSAEVRMRAEYNIKKKRRLKSVVDGQTELLKVREKEIKSLKAQLLVKEAKAAEAIQSTTTLEKEKSKLEIKVADLVASVKVREQEVADLDTVVTSVKSQNDSLVDQEKVTAYKNCIDQLEKFHDDKMKEVNDKFDQLYTDFVEMALHLEEKFYLHLLTTIFGRRWLLTHGMELAIAKCLNSTEYLSTLRAAIGKAVEKADGSHFYRSLDQTIVGATALSLSLDVSHVRVQKIMENITNHRSALRDIFIPLADPLSSVALEGTEGTSGTAPNTTTALYVTFASVSSIPPISTDDYEVVHADGQEGIGADANPFPYR
ncbi:hypothetical protein Tco_0815708 [Tanacetum coccineum]